MKYTGNAEIPAQHDEDDSEDVHVPPVATQEEWLEAASQVPSSDRSVCNDGILIPKAGIEEPEAVSQAQDETPSDVSAPEAQAGTKIMVETEDAPQKSKKTPPKRVQSKRAPLRKCYPRRATRNKAPAHKNKHGEKVSISSDDSGNDEAPLRAVDALLQSLNGCRREKDSQGYQDIEGEKEATSERDNQGFQEIEGEKKATREKDNQSFKDIEGAIEAATEKNNEDEKDIEGGNDAAGEKNAEGDKDVKAEKDVAGEKDNKGDKDADDEKDVETTKEAAREENDEGEKGTDNDTKHANEEKNTVVDKGNKNESTTEYATPDEVR
ncbi:RNA polymerase-associated protein CTR9 homolog [Dioscorea cayenensis subsp. rotundata]|uniref:RNA polymerase-associated protein CTR9 homolog n=1 Tax=Dioscorea cayennensis subsp. rotundata TaxID=55577 RepID=A0AB40AUP4_DIOCR|nr:RNA polymerase-associated protein CTR9 homolog [Dioscorea cayenensis subsp. rotundata]